MFIRTVLVLMVVLIVWACASKLVLALDMCNV
jgi:hypothetical protein